LPSDLFVKAPFIYSGPDFISFPLGMISDLINYRGKSIQRFCPLTISRLLSNGALVDQVFCFAFLYLKDNGNLTLFLTQPYWLDKSDLQESSDFFFAKAEELARSAGSESLEVEIHSQIVPPVSFPSSLSDFSYDLDSMKPQEVDSRSLEERGFQEEKALFCYDQTIDEVQDKIEEKHGSKGAFTTGDMTQNEFSTIDAQTCQFPLREHCLSLKDPIMTQRMVNFFGDTGSVAHKSGTMFSRRSIEGFLHWSPNLFEAIRENPSPFPFLFYDYLVSHRFKCGKVFRWRMRQENPELLSSLLSHSLHSMKQCGLERCQISSVDNRQTFVKSMLESYGFHIVHVTRLLRKEL